MKTNFFGERICDKKCPLWVDDGEDGFCDARLDFNGRIGVKDGIIQYGKLCELPNNVLIIKRTES